MDDFIIGFIILDFISGVIVGAILWNAYIKWREQNRPPPF